MEVPQSSVGGQTGTKRRRDRLPRKIEHSGQIIPKRHLGKIPVGNVGPGNDQRIQSLLLQRLEITVISLDVGLGCGTPLDPRQREGMDVELGDPITPPDQAHELALGWL